MNPTITEIEIVLRRWMSLAADANLPAPVRKTLTVCAIDLAETVKIELPAAHTFSDDVVSREQPSGEHVV